MNSLLTFAPSAMPVGIAGIFGATVLTINTPAQAQVPPIQADLSVNGTGTNVDLQGNQFNIDGGIRSGTNLFHSFQQFGLNEGQIANFLSKPEIQNILGRVVGGDPSVINGLIQVIGGQSNVFLMNPAGIIFGANASLNVPASFTATTATGISIGNNWFNASGANNYAALVGTPNAFAFTTPQPGAIINAGNLTVPSGQSLSFLGGIVLNTGQLKAPGGQITVSAVPGDRLVRISQQGNLLSLDIQPLTSADNQPTNWALPILSLPQLLTGGNRSSGIRLTVNSDGQAVLTGSGFRLDADTGTVIVSGNLDASNTVSDQAGGTVQVLGSQVKLVEQAQINVSGETGGGTALIGGDYQGKGPVPNATLTDVGSGVTISANALTQGNGGKVIVWSDKATNFYGNISARGGSNSGNGGFVEVSGKENLTFAGAVDTSAPKGNLGTLLLDPDTLNITDTPTGGAIGTNTVSWGLINSLGATANIVLDATGKITIEDITGATSGTNNLVKLGLGTGGNLTLQSTGGDVIFADSNDTIQTQGGSLEVLGRNIRLGNLTTTPDGGFTPKGAIKLSGATIVAGNLTGDSINLSGATILARNLTGNSIISISTISDIIVEKIIGDSISLTATAGGIKVGSTNDYNTPEGIDGTSVELLARNTINVVGRIAGFDRFVEGGIIKGTVKLRSTAGDVIVGTIRAGSGGVDITAANLFQARGTFTLSDILSEVITLQNNSELRNFLEARGIIFEPDQFVHVKSGRDGEPRIPISILAVPNNTPFDGSISGSVKIHYGDASRTLINQRFPISPNGSTFTFGSIELRGGAGAFSLGPTVSGKLADNIDDKFVTIDKAGNFVPVNSSTFTLDPNDPSSSPLFRNERYTSKFPSATFPADISGTAGAILVGWGTNTSYYGSTQSRIFNPVVPPPPPNPNPIVPPPSPNQNPIVPPTPPNQNPIVQPPSPNPDPIATNPTNPTNRPNRVPTEQEQKAQNNTSTDLSVSDYTGAVLNISLASPPEACNATQLVATREGKLELRGSCVQKQDEDSK
jgi:filamentous hemagglutinin family protein